MLLKPVVLAHPSSLNVISDTKPELNLVQIPMEQDTLQNTTNVNPALTSVLTLPARLDTLVLSKIAPTNITLPAVPPDMLTSTIVRGNANSLKSCLKTKSKEKDYD